MAARAGRRSSDNHYVWADLIQYAEQHWRIETQEVINTLLIELYPELVDELRRADGGR